MITLQSGYSQEMDKSKSNKKKLQENRFKIRNKQGDKKHKGDITGRKSKTKKTKKKFKVNSAASSPYGNSLYRYKNRKKEGKDVEQSGGYYNTPSRSTENYRKGDISGRKPRRSATRPSEGKRVIAASGGLNSISRSGEDKRKKRKRIQPRSASRAYIAKRKGGSPASITRRGEQARTKSLSGQGLRFKNFSSKRFNRVIKPSLNPYFGRKNKGDRSHPGRKDAGYSSVSKRGERKYKGRATGGYSSATKRGENAWKKDITGRKFKRPADLGIVTGKKGQPFTGTQSRRLSISGSLKNNGRKSVSNTGGGGSISGQVKRGRKSALPRKDLGTPKVSGFAGRFKRFEMSPEFDTHSSRYQGNAKGSRKPLKGGGSITNSIKKGKGRALPRKNLGTPKVSGFAGRFKRFEMSPEFDTRSSRYQGNAKGSRKPLKGGGSITNSIKKGKGRALPRKDLGSPKVSGFAGRFKRFEMSPEFDTRSSRYQGNAKGSRKPLKGGGSISGKRWNNKRTPLIYKYSQNKGIANFKGRFKRFEISPGFMAEGASKRRGNLKMKRNYVKKPNVHEDALKGIAPKSSAYKAMAFQGNFKTKKNYNRNMHPSAKYTTSQHPRNSIAEKNRAFKFNIWWAKLFKKNENKPPAVKEKIRTPRYDKREKDLWYK